MRLTSTDLGRLLIGVPPTGRRAKVKLETLDSLESQMKVVRRLLVIAMVALAVVAFWSYRTSVLTSTASEFKPTTRQLMLIPAGTRIPAILPYGITEGTKPGEKVVAFVSPPVIINKETAVPQGAQLTGIVDQIEKQHGKASTRLNFSMLAVGNRLIKIQTDPVVATVPVTTDFQILGNAFEATTSAVLGITQGAGSRDERAIGWGAVRGTLVTPGLDSNVTPITVVLNRPVQLLQ